MDGFVMIDNALVFNTLIL